MKTGPISGALLETLRQLEESLWRGETRFDDSLMDQTFAADFEEFGRSGRRYQRDEMFFGATESKTIPALLPLRDLSARWIDQDTVLITYVSEVNYPSALEHGNRASLWSRSSKGWKLRFHQGTPVAGQTD